MFGFTRLTSHSLLPAVVQITSASTTSPFSGLSRSPFGFGSNISLSTLRLLCYRRTRKTRYAVVRVQPSAAGLSPASSAPLHGALRLWTSVWSIKSAIKTFPAIQLAHKKHHLTGLVEI